MLDTLLYLLQIFEGILSFFDKDILDMLDMKVFVDTDPDIRLSRRLRRDISQRGRDLKVIFSLIRNNFHN